MEQKKQISYVEEFQTIFIVNSLNLKDGLHIVTSFGRIQHEIGNRNITVEKSDKHPFSQVMKVNINSDKSC